MFWVNHKQHLHLDFLHTPHVTVSLTFHRKIGTNGFPTLWVPRISARQQQTNDFIDTLAIKAWNNLRANLMIFAIQKYSNLVKRKKRHTALKWGFPRDVSHPQSPLALKFHDSDCPSLVISIIKSFLPFSTLLPPLSHS